MLRPAPNIHIVLIEDDLVALDVENDAYFCLSDVAPFLATDGRGGWAPSNPEIAAGLLETGLFRPGRSGAKAPPAPCVFRTSRTPGAVARTGRFNLITVFLREAWRVHRRPLKTLIARSPNLPLRPADIEAAMADARLFDRWMPWIPGQGQCLYRAYLLRAFLAARGRGATWVFGVRTWPFSAHCWLQIGDVLLDDDLDRVALYTPILAVGA